MSVVRVGTNKKYSTNWDSIFSKGQKKMAKPAASSPQKAVGKKQTAKAKKRK